MSENSVVVKKKSSGEVVSVDNINSEEVVDSYIQSIGEGDIISKSNCKLCQHELRSEAEQMYEKSNRNARKVHLYLSSEGVDVSYPAVKNHLEQHYLEQIKRIEIKNYLSNVREFAAIRKNQETHVKMSIVILEEKLLKLAAETSNAPVCDQSKAIPQIISLVGAISDLYDKINEIEGEDRKISIVMDHFKDVVSLEISNVSSNEAKTAVMSVLEKFTERLEQSSLLE